MKRKLKAAVALAGALVLVLMMAGPGSVKAGAAENTVVPEASWSIGVRTVPLPEGASDELRKMLKAIPAPKYQTRIQITPKDVAGWEAMQKERDERGNATAKALAKQFSVAVEREEIDGVTVYRVMPKEVDSKHKDHLFFHIHGGSYVFGGGESSVVEAIIIAARAEIPVLSVDYRRPPQHPFPAGLNDVVTVYKHLLRNRAAKSIAMGGTSAGGGLALASIHKCIQLGLELPGALFAGTPWSDLTKTGDSYFINEGIDRVLVTNDGLLEAAARLYAGGHDLRDPLLSPVYGNFQDFPPTYLLTGTRDLFLSNTARVHAKMRAAGVVADLMVFEGVSHADYLFEPGLPESRQLFAEMSKFLLQHLH